MYLHLSLSVCFSSEVFCPTCLKFASKLEAGWLTFSHDKTAETTLKTILSYLLEDASLWNGFVIHNTGRKTAVLYQDIYRREEVYIFLIVFYIFNDVLCLNIICFPSMWECTGSSTKLTCYGLSHVLLQISEISISIIIPSVSSNFNNTSISKSSVG